MSGRFTVMLMLLVVCVWAVTEARYLPTRGQDDRLDRLRELLRDLLEGEMEKTSNANSYDRHLIYKREVPEDLPVYLDQARQ
uniref:Proctolin n=1 Tax=Carausius morosus TaxID=7022 RepID=A0A6G4ZU42_CARMO|nr:proctolin [Carausius morosus]